MSLEAVPSPASAPPAPTRLTRIGVALRAMLTIRRLRLASGLVLFAYALTHFLNHSLGLISLEAMEIGQTWRYKVTRTDFGSILIYGAFLIHIPLGLWRVARLRTWRMPLAEALQIGLGLAIPILLVKHIIFTRGAATLFDWPDYYVTELKMLWPDAAFDQTALMLLVWTHSCIGLHYWLRTQGWYQRTAHLFLAPAVLIPALALAGFAVGGREALATVSTLPNLTEQQTQILRRYKDYSDGILIGIGVALAGILLWPLLRAFGRRGVTVRYPSGRIVRAVPGQTILEISRASGVPHAAVCGGRARCSTCRVMITAGFDKLPKPKSVERAVLARIGAPDGVRLACQTRPTADLSVVPLVATGEAQELAAAMRDPYRWGVERRVTVMFADLRKFTALSEKHYAYDVVFLLNRYFKLMTEAVESNGGLVDKFIGDSVMAIFGIETTQGGAADAIRAAKDMEAAMAMLNEEFAAVLAEPIRMGVGLHMGSAILGRVGTTAQRGAQTTLTALGDTVNIASRLEGATKEYDCFAVMSQETLAASGFMLPQVERHEIMVRGKSQPLKVATVKGFGDEELVQDLMRLKIPAA